MSRQNTSVPRARVQLVKVTPKRDYVDVKVRGDDQQRFLTSYGTSYNRP